MEIHECPLSEMIYLIWWILHSYVRLLDYWRVSPRRAVNELPKIDKLIFYGPIKWKSNFKQMEKQNHTIIALNLSYLFGA